LTPAAAACTLAVCAFLALSCVVQRDVGSADGLGTRTASLLDDASEIRAEHRARALQRIHERKIHKLRLMAHRVEDDPDVHILKHEDRTLDAIEQLGSTKHMHLSLARVSAGGSTAIASGGGGDAVPGKHEQAPTTVAAVSRIARKAGVKISAKITHSEQEKAAELVAALMSSAKFKLHKARPSAKTVFHSKMRQALFDYKLYQGRKGHIAVADAHVCASACVLVHACTSTCVH
jgi:hypothetical protein